MMIYKVITVIAFLLLLVAFSEAQSFSNLQKDNLLGNVNSVRKEQTWTSKENRKYVEGKPVLMTVENYDRKGNKIEWAGYFGDVNAIRNIFVYNDEGKVIEELSYDSTDELKSKTTYSYNARGNLIEENISNGIKVVYSYTSKNNKRLERAYDLAKNEGGRMFGSAEKNVYFHYYKNNKLKEIGSYNFDGSRVWNPEIQAHRIVYTYNSKGQTSFVTVFNEDNSVRSKTRYIYNSNGIVIKEFVFNAEDKANNIYNYIYEFDQIGNWTKQNKLKQLGRNNKLRNIPVETIYRKIIYY